MRADFFNEALVTAMLAASSGKGAAQTLSAQESDDMTQAATLGVRLASLMDQAGKTALQAGIPGDLVEAADFAVCAFIDEALLSSTSWQGHTEWMKKPLQFVRHDTATGGEDFYRLLEALLADAEKTMPAGQPLSESPKGMSLARTEKNLRDDPLCATLEVFALCLAQGFTGMLYATPAAIREQLERIGRFVPSVSGCPEPFFCPPDHPVKEPRSLGRASNLFRRFDLLDWTLWLIPPALTMLLFYVCDDRLDQMIQPFLQGGTLP
jgi:Uncharacterized protein conserved in bacteria